MVHEVKAELLSGRIQKLTNLRARIGTSNPRQSENQKLLLRPFCLWTDSTDPDQLWKSCLSHHLYYGYAQISSRRCHWRIGANGEWPGFLETVSNKTKLEMLFSSASWSKSWASTVILFSWTAPSNKIIEPLNMSVSHKIATGPFSPGSTYAKLLRKPTRSILLQLEMKPFLPLLHRKN